MSRNDRRVATILAIIIIFIGLILGQRKTEFLKNLDESFLECKCGVTCQDLKRMSAYLDQIHSTMIENKYKITPTFALIFSGNFAIEYLQYVNGSRKRSWQRLNDLVNDHPFYKRISISDHLNFLLFEESEELFQFIAKIIGNKIFKFVMRCRFPELINPTHNFGAFQATDKVDTCFTAPYNWDWKGPRVHTRKSPEWMLYYFPFLQFYLKRNDKDKSKIIHKQFFKDFIKQKYEEMQMTEYVLSDFKDMQFLTAQQKYKAFKRFKSVIEKRDIHLMDKNLYEHLHLHCGYIAHYDINGFKATYNDPQDFLRFCEHFLKHNGQSLRWPSMSDYADVNRAMCEILEQHIDKIRQEAVDFQNETELSFLHRLAEKHGLKVQTPTKAGEQLVLI